MVTRKVVAIVVAGGAVAAAGADRAGAQVRAEWRGGLATAGGELGQMTTPGATIGAAIGLGVAGPLGVRVDVEVTMLEESEMGDTPTPGVNLAHLLFGPELVLPPRRRLRARVGASAGVTAFEVEAFSNANLPPGEPNVLEETYPTVGGSLSLEWLPGRRLAVFATGRALVTLTNEEDTARLSYLTPEIEPFDRAWTYPLSAGLAIRF